MQFKIKVRLSIIGFICLSTIGYCQNKPAERDFRQLYNSEFKQIDAQAKGTVKSLYDLLNFISGQDTTNQVETTEAIENSFNDHAISFFDNTEFRVYYDIEPGAYNKSTSRLVPVKQYLKDFDIFYLKDGSS